MLMLQLSGSFINASIMSLRTGGPVGVIQQPIINPNNLKIEGFYCNDRFSKDRLILLSQEIRDVIPDGVVVNDHEAMTEPEDLIRFKEITALQFDLFGKRVVTNTKRQLGKITDYAVETSSMHIQKMYVSQPLTKTLRGGQLSIDRSQILEITDKKIVVQEPTITVNNTEAQPLIKPAIV